MLNDTDLTARLTELLQDTAQAFLRSALANHSGPMSAADLEIRLAVRCRTMPLQPNG